MQFTYKELEQLTGLAYYALVQWKQRGLIDNDGESDGRTVTFTDEMTYRTMWLAELSKRHVPLEQALSLWFEAMKKRKPVLLLPQGEWAGDKTHSKRMFEDGAFCFAVSVPYFLEEAKQRIASLKRVTKFRRKVGFPTVEDELVGVH
jgi:hypothetical protein